MTAITAQLTQDPLWTRARAMFTRAVADIGDAASIAVLTSLPRILRRQIVGWLYPIECIVRRLLIAEAAELHRAQLARAKRAVRIEHIPLRGMAQHWQGGNASLRARIFPQPPALCEPEGSRSNLDRSSPETWRARFSFALPRNPRLVPNARAPRILDPLGDYPQPPPPAHAAHPQAGRLPVPSRPPFRSAAPRARRSSSLRRTPCPCSRTPSAQVLRGRAPDRGARRAH